MAQSTLQSSELLNPRKRRRMGESNEDADEDKNILEEDNETLASNTKETLSTVSAIRKKSSTLSKRRSANLVSSDRKKQKVLLEVPQLPKTGGELLVVGENDVGQLGLTLDVPSAGRPKHLKLEHEVISVAAGGLHTVYLSEKGEVYTFGCNDESALGRETIDEDAAAVPGKVYIPECIVQVTAGDSHSGALTSSGKVFIWGNFRDSNGHTGLTSNGHRQETPLQILQDKIIVKIASGDNHFACLSDEGVLYTCGCAEQGQLGRISPRSVDGGRRGKEHVLTPAPVFMKRNAGIFDEVWTGSFTTFARKKDTGAIYGFGLNNYNQLGLPDQGLVFFPKCVKSFSGQKWKMISGGQHHTVALDEDGKVYTMGRKEYGRLGLGTNCEDRGEPTCIALLEDCTSICAGDTVSFAVTENGKVYSWGRGDSRQLGHGNDDDVFSPQLISSVSSKKTILVSAGAQHTAIIARTVFQ